jgi:flavin reductase (NADH)
MCASADSPADAFRIAMRELAGTVTVVTATAGADEAAMTATSVCSVSAEPPQLLACVHRGGRTHTLIAASGKFAINVLSPQHADLARHYSAAGRTGGLLMRGRWLRSSERPPLLADALAAFGCEVVQAVDAGTHTVFIGRVVYLTCRGTHPLIYRQGAFGRFVEMAPELPHEILDY